MQNNFITKDSIIAVVGVSSNPEKYGYKVFIDLLKKGYRVLPIHSDGGIIEGQIRYRSLYELPEKPDLVITVVPPENTKIIAHACKTLGIKKLWMQPGSENPETIEFCKKHNILYVIHSCIMAQSIKT